MTPDKRVEKCGNCGLSTSLCILLQDIVYEENTTIRREMAVQFRKEATNTLTQYHQDRMSEVVGASKVVLYVEKCWENSYRELSHEDRLKLNADEVCIYLGDATDGVWGDDWNDAPDEGNSGIPYDNTVKGLKKIIVKLGKPLSN